VIVDRPGSVQSELRIGHVGIARDHADYFPAAVMASLLGGTFSSRLNQRLREDLGYTYGARAAFDPRRAAGPFIARAAVHTEVTADAVTETFAILDGMQGAPPPADELREVTDYLIGVFPLRFETTAGAGAGIEPVAVYDLDHEWWATYRNRIEAVGPGEVHHVATTLLRPAKALVVVVGDAAAVRPALETANLGPVEVIRPADDEVAEA
jgi:predicted Zn-dependent peptidase